MKRTISRKAAFVCGCVCVIAAPLLLLAVSSENAQSPCLYLIDSYGIHKRLAENDEARTVFNTAGLYMVKFTLSPSDTTIALLITESGYTPPEEHYSTELPKNHMVFTDTAGKEIARLDEDVRRYSWSPGGQKIAYITGTYYEGGVGFMVTGVGVFDLRSGAKTAINRTHPHPSLKDYEGGGYEIYWAPHDSSIYIEDFGYVGGSYRYDTKTGKTEQIPYLSVNLSPDGRYYIGPQGEGYDSLQLYRTATNDEVFERFWRRFGRPEARHSINWVFDRGHVLHVTTRQTVFAEGKEHTFANALGMEMTCNVLYDVEKDEIVKELDSPASLWTAGPGKLVLEKDGKFQVLTYEDVYEEH